MPILLDDWKPSPSKMRAGTLAAAVAEDGTVPAYIAARLSGKGRGWIYYHISRGDIPVVRRSRGRRGFRFVKMADVQALIDRKPLYVDATGKVYIRPKNTWPKVDEPLSHDHAHGVFIRLRLSEWKLVDQLAYESSQSRNELCRQIILGALENLSGVDE